MFRIGSKTFREPDIFEIQETDRIAIPLMCQFVSNSELVGVISGDDIAAQSGHRLVFHSTIGIHAYRGMPVFFKGIGAKDLREIIDHGGYRGKIYHGIVVLRLSNETQDGQFTFKSALSDLHIRPGCNANQIGGHGMFTQPDGGGSSITIVGNAVPQSVCGYFPVVAHGDMQIHDGFIPGVVITRPPLASGIRIGDGEDRICDKMHADTVEIGTELGIAAVIDLGGEDLSGNGIHRDLDDAIGMGESADDAIYFHRTNGKPDKFITDEGKDVCGFHSSEDIAANVLAAGIDREVNHVFLHVKTMSTIGSGLAPAVKIRTGHRVTGFPLGGFPAGICINNAQ